MTSLCMYSKTCLHCMRLTSWGPFLPCAFRTVCHSWCFAGAMWLATSFFLQFSSALAQPGIDIKSPADAVFLTQTDLELLNWDQATGLGNVWKQAVQTALKEISLEDRFKLCKQRFPQSLASFGVQDAGMEHSLQLQCLDHLLACKCLCQCCSYDIICLHLSVRTCSGTSLPYCFCVQS